MNMIRLKYEDDEYESAWNFGVVYEYDLAQVIQQFGLLEIHNYLVADRIIVQLS